MAIGQATGVACPLALSNGSTSRLGRLASGEIHRVHINSKSFFNMERIVKTARQLRKRKIFCLHHQFF
jgi:hypothetical protein